MMYAYTASSQFLNNLKDIRRICFDVVCLVLTECSRRRLQTARCGLHDVHFPHVTHSGS